MRIGSVLENQKIEKRISITPEIAKKYKSIGLDVCLSKNYGAHLGISDEEYKNLGVKFFNDEKEIINLSNIVVQLVRMMKNLMKKKFKLLPMIMLNLLMKKFL